MSNPENKSQLNNAETYDLNGLVEYAEGSAVSRTLYKNNAGTITMFSFDKGQNISEHSAPFDALVQVIDGAGELVIGGKSVMAKTGEIVLMPANIPHAVKANEKFKMLLIMMKG